MDELLTADEFQEKIRSICDEQGILKELRTHLRKVLVTKLQGGVVDKPFQQRSLRDRSVLALILDWLRVENCHYTLSVLASEIPSLADFPGIMCQVAVSIQRFVTTATTRHLKDCIIVEDGLNLTMAVKLEAELMEFLYIFGLDDEEIVSEYLSSDGALISSILKIAAKWKVCLAFKESTTDKEENDDIPEWCKQLRNILSSASIHSSQIIPTFNALRRLIQKTVEDNVNHREETLWAEVVEREKKMQLLFKKQEDNISKRLVEAEQGLDRAKDTTNENFTAMRVVLNELSDDVQKQHKSVLKALAELQERKKSLEREELNFRNEIDIDLRKSKIMEKTLEEKRKELNIWKENLEKREMQLISEEKKLQMQLPSVLPTTLLTSDTSSTSAAVDESDRVWRRLKDLKEEAKRNKDAFYSYRTKPFITDSSTISDDEPSTDCLRRTTKRSSLGNGLSLSHQVTYPSRHEGCHSGAYSTISIHRKKGLTSSGDQTKGSNRSKIPRPLCESETISRPNMASAKMATPLDSGKHVKRNATLHKDGQIVRSRNDTNNLRKPPCDSNCFKEGVKKISPSLVTSDRNGSTDDTESTTQDENEPEALRSPAKVADSIPNIPEITDLIPINNWTLPPLKTPEASSQMPTTHVSTPLQTEDFYVTGDVSTKANGGIKLVPGLRQITLRSCSDVSGEAMSRGSKSDDDFWV